MELRKEKTIVGKCPVCGGDIIESAFGFCCKGTLKNGKKCGFSIRHELRGVKMEEPIVKQLLECGSTDDVEMTNKYGKPYRGHFIIDEGKVGVEQARHYLNGRCPLCGGRMLKTAKGYECENSCDPRRPKTCSFKANGILCNRMITESEMELYLSGKPQNVLDGFVTREGKVFSSILETNAGMQCVSLTAVVGKCPSCGGELRIKDRTFKCENHKDEKEPCKFQAWRHISGHEITLQEIEEIRLSGMTREPVELYRDDGSIYFKHLGLSEDKTHITILTD